MTRISVIQLREKIEFLKHYGRSARLDSIRPIVQKQIAEKCKLSPSRFSEILNNRQGKTRQDVTEISKHFNESIGDLFEFDSSKHAWLNENVDYFEEYYRSQHQDHFALVDDPGNLLSPDEIKRAKRRILAFYASCHPKWGIEKFAEKKKILNTMEALYSIAICSNANDSPVIAVENSLEQCLAQIEKDGGVVSDTIRCETVHNAAYYIIFIAKLVELNILSETYFTESIFKSVVDRLVFSLNDVGWGTFTSDKIGADEVRIANTLLAYRALFSLKDFDEGRIIRPFWSFIDVLRSGHFGFYLNDRERGVIVSFVLRLLCVLDGSVHAQLEEIVIKNDIVSRLFEMEVRNEIEIEEFDVRGSEIGVERLSFRHITPFIALGALVRTKKYLTLRLKGTLQQQATQVIRSSLRSDGGLEVKGLHERPGRLLTYPFASFADLVVEMGKEHA